MKFFWFGYLLMVSGYRRDHDRGNVVSRYEFLDMSDYFTREAITMAKTIESLCDTDLNNYINGTESCFLLNVNNTEPCKLFQAIFLTESDVKKANKYIKQEVDEVRAIFAKDPECKIVHFDLEYLKTTRSGPRNIAITKYDTENVNQEWEVGATVSYSPLEKNLESGDIFITSDILEGVMHSTSLSIGPRFNIPKHHSCRPCLQRSSIVCNNVSFRTSYFRKGKEVVGRWSSVSPDSPSERLIPIDRGD